ncbi:MAG: amino acid--tRNA ligase-related protein [Patescibacteria group bacterium]|jgi:lysyl-tRNA synthetase class 2
MLGKDDLKLRAELWNGVISQVHAFFQSKNYLEVRTPVLVKCPGMEPNLDPVGVDVRLIDGTKHRRGLITSPEYSMKKLLGAGLDKIYTLTPVFRNVEKMGERWSVEFTMLEWYRTNADYHECMKETEELVDMILGSEKAGLSTPRWPRISYVDEYQKYFGVHPADETLDASKVADRFQFEVMPKLEAQYPRFFLTEYPVAEAALAQKNADGRSAQRFEGYVNGLEICNGFTELVDSTEQRKRFELEAEERRLAGKEVFPIDEELLAGLSSVPSPTFGNALGIDRLIMLKAGAKDIDSIHLFPPSTRF